MLDCDYITADWYNLDSKGQQFVEQQGLAKFESFPRQQKHHDGRIIGVFYDWTLIPSRMFVREKIIKRELPIFTQKSISSGRRRIFRQVCRWAKIKSDLPVKLKKRKVFETVMCKYCNGTGKRKVHRWVGGDK